MVDVSNQKTYVILITWKANTLPTFFVIPWKYITMISFGLEGSTVSNCNEIVILIISNGFQTRTRGIA